jgi:SSS family solute:Na+ symporter
VVALGVIVAFYTFWGGMRAVAWTDAIQSLIMIVAAFTLLIYVIHVLVGGFDVFALRLESEFPELLKVPGPPRGAGRWFSFLHFLGLTIPWFFFSITNPQVVQRFFIPKSIRSLKNMIRGFLVFGFTYTIIVTLLGLACRLLIPSIPKPDLAMPTLLGFVPAPLALIVMVSIIAAAVSTSDSILLTLSSMAAVDIYRNLKPKALEEESLRFGKIVIGVIMVLLILFSLRPAGLIVELSVTSSAYLLQFVPATFGAFFWKRATASAALSSIILGCLVTGILYFTGLKPLGMWPAIWGIAVSSLVFVIVSFITKPRKLS